MFKKMLVVAAMSAVAVSAFASDVARNAAKEVTELKDGSTLYVFQDGKMAMESAYGQARHMAPGTVMEGKDGQKISMNGSEVAKLDILLKKDYFSNSSGGNGK